MSIQFIQKRESSTWGNFPKIGGSKYGFIGLIAGIAVLILLIIIIAICCCIKRSRNKKRMRKAAIGGDLETYHPPPTFGRHENSTRKIQFTPVPRMDDYETSNGVAPYPTTKSSRNSLTSYGQAYSTQQNTTNQPSSDYDGDGSMAMNGVNNQRYYRGSEGFRQNYNYSPAPPQAMNEYNGSNAAGYGGYDYGYGSGSERFAEPQYDPTFAEQQQQQHYSSQNISYDQYGNHYTSPSPAPQMPTPAMSPYPYQAGSHQQAQQHPQQGNAYNTNAGASGPAYIDYQRSQEKDNRLPGTDI